MTRPGERARRRDAVLGVLGLVLASSFATAARSQEPDWLHVKVGHRFVVGENCRANTRAGCREAESTRFLAPALRVHTNDVIEFSYGGDHTATMLARPTDVAAWTEANTGVAGKPYALATEDPDDTPLDPGGSESTPSLKANWAATLPSSFNCGAPIEPCDYDGAHIVNSGFSSLGDLRYAMRITAEPSDEPIWVVCLFHPHMRLRVTVVPPDQPVTTQAEINQYRRDAVAADRDWAASIDKKLMRGTGSRVASDERVVDVYAGFDNHSVAISAMYPPRVVVAKGQTVRFHFSNVIYEKHTVTFPIGRALALVDEMFAPNCDPDGDEGPGPDEASEDPSIGCEGGEQDKIEIDFVPHVVYSYGDGVFGGKDFETSGIRGSDAGLEPMDLEFTRPNRRGYEYVCLFHPSSMKGRVIVTARRAAP